MTINEFKHWFVEALKDGPIKATELPVKLAQERLVVLEMDAVFAAIEDLIRTGQVIHISYSNPNTSYRTKSMYFHQQSKMIVTNKLATL